MDCWWIVLAAIMIWYLVTVVDQYAQSVQTPGRYVGVVVLQSLVKLC
jgi:hypothetical protein